MRLAPALLLFCMPFAADAEVTPDTVTSFAKKIVDTLASPFMHGRGYFKNGDKLAAQFIATQFSKMRIDWQYQDFPLSVNTFPKKVTVSLHSQQNVEGIPIDCGPDFIVDAGSRPVKGKFPLVWIDSSVVLSDASVKDFLASDYDGKAIVIEHENIRNKKIRDRLLSLARLVKTSLVIFADNKLTHSVASELETYPAIHVLSGKIQKKHYAISVNIKTKFIPRYPIRNVIAKVEGKIPDSTIIFSAHYDHLGRMGPDVLFPGANDNGSGIAMLLTLAKHYSNPKNKPLYTMVFIAFGGEEIGLVGSRYYVDHPTVPLQKIRFLINMDILGTGDDGITVVNATEHESDFKQLVKLNSQGSYLKEVKSRGKAANSDHYWFSEKGVSAFFIYTLGGIKAYHDIYDRRETLPLTEFRDLFELLLDFTSHLEN